MPWLRRWSPRWRRLPDAREAFLRAVGLAYDPRLAQVQRVLPWGGIAPGAEGLERAQDLAVTTLVGAADAPVLLALEALSCPPPPIKRAALDAAEEAEGPAGRRALVARTAVSAALERRPPVPLALREAVRAVEVPGLGVLRPGQAVAVDLGAAGWPFGKWAHACPGAGDGRAFAEAAVRVCSELGLRAAPQRLRRRRVRLAWGLERLLWRFEARAGARGGGA